MQDNIFFRSGYGEQQRGVDRFRFSFDDLQNRVTPVVRVLSAYPSGAVAGASLGDRLLVLASDAPKRAGLYTVDSSGLLVRPADFAAGFTLNTTLAALDTSTNTVWQIRPALGHTAVIDTGDLVVTQAGVAGPVSLVTYVDEVVGALASVNTPNRRYLVVVAGSATNDSGVWYHDGSGAVRPRDMDAPFARVLVIVTSGGLDGQFILTNATPTLRPSEPGFLCAAVAVAAAPPQTNHRVDYVIQALDRLGSNSDTIKAHIGATAALPGPVYVLVLHNLQNAAQNGVYEVTDTSAVRPAWWVDRGGGGAENQFGQVVQHAAASGGTYMNTGVGRIDTDPSRWIRVDRPDLYSSVWPSFVSGTDSVGQFPVAATHAVVFDPAAALQKVYERSGNGSWVAWTDLQRRQNFFSAFVAMNDTADVSLGDVFVFGSVSGGAVELQRAGVQPATTTLVQGSRDATCPADGTLVVQGGLGVRNSVHADRMQLWSNTASSSTDTGALIVAGGVGVAGDVHADAMYADSDRRLKRDISAIDDEEALEMVLQMYPQRYSYNRDVSERRRIGLVAQQLQPIVPEAVKAAPETGLLSVDMQQLVPLMAGGIRALKKIMDAQKRGDTS